MNTAEVLIVGAGPAGIAAALRLARAGVRVLVLEGAEYAGAENWSGCVYHADPLLRPDVLGAALWAEAPKERRIVSRALFFHDGASAAGYDARANQENDYGEAWTVLRPKLDRWLAARAVDFGATILPATTVTGLRYREGRVVGVHTERGNIDADVVFIAEGDAAGLLAREGLEQQPQIHYAQGIKAVFELPADEIERRFGVRAGEGTAQEWILRNGRHAGRMVPLNATAFLYTNTDSLSLGLVLPLTALATAMPADHAHLLERVTRLPGIAPYLRDARQVAYGAKVIRAGGLNETPIWVRDGLAVGGGALGLGMEFPYPNFIGPAITSALCFADGFLRLRERGSTYRATELESEYTDRLKQTADYANAALLRDWPAAIHAGGLLFSDVPALLGQYAASRELPHAEGRSQRQKAVATQLGRLRASLQQARALTRGLKTSPANGAIAPLTVQFVTVDAQGAHAVDPSADPILPVIGEVIGHFYGRKQDMHARMGAIVNVLRRHALGLTARASRLVGDSLAGGWQLLGDLAAYKVRKVPLRALLSRPYHRHDEQSLRQAAWPLRAAALSPTAWLAPMARHQPDPRHIFLPLELSFAAAQQLRRVCPAEVYTPTSRWGGADSQYENCIKCESCRVTVPGVDWNRTSGHRLSYRVPGDGRYGFDGSVVSAITAALDSPPPVVDGANWRALYRALRERPAHVGIEWPNFYRRCLAHAEGNVALAQRLQQWLARGAYGWMERELHARLPAQLSENVYEVAADTYATRKRIHTWQSLRAVFTPETLRALATRGWTAGEYQMFARWIDEARADRNAALTWLAQWSPALAWSAAQHYLAEDACGRAINDRLASIVGRLDDAATNWLPHVAQQLLTAEGKVWTPSEVQAHGAGLDAARPVRYAAPTDMPTLPVSPHAAHAALCIAIGMAQTLSERARDYAAQRVQFRGDLRDSEGRDSIAKFGAIKAMLAGIAQTVAVLDLARPHCDATPQRVLNLIHARMGLRIDAVPWMAGQIFGGMAYSEEDILAPRYRDAMVLSQWPCAGLVDRDAANAFAAELLAASNAGAPRPFTENLLQFTRTRLMQPEIAPATLTEPREAAAPRRVPRGRPLIWDSTQKITYRSGNFLNGRLLSDAEVLTPEHFRRDPRLRATRVEVLRLLRSGFRSPDKNESYGHYIDRVHGVPAEDIDRLRAFNAFATVAPARLGGKGWNKAQYAVLNTLTMGFGDTSLGLLIMASTSIGTMPVMLGLDYDLPRLQRELNACLADHAGWQQLDADVTRAAEMLAHPDPKALTAVLTRIGTTARRLFMAPGSALKYLARDYLLSLQDMAEVAKSRDLDRLASKLAVCRSELAPLRELFIAEQSALPLRVAAHERFLRFLASGQISAFALTEPVAGSDTGGIQTRAVLRSVPVTPDANGFYRFIPHGASEARVLLDAQRLVFEDRDVRYRLADGALGTLDDSAWDLPRNAGERRIRLGKSVYRFDDIGTVLKHDGAWLYRYWEITGNKMWITNGSVCDRYALYAQTDFGETGFMVERRAEGLRIGPNENKLGQRASPTNELTFERVRVSADQVIGFRGHGQVNALETLSVGRGGLVTGCATMVDRILDIYAPLWRAHPAQMRAAQFELDRLQTLAARLVGLMDRADLSRGDFRIEAALSKYLASEGLHRVFGWLEHIRGPMAASVEASIEKWRRDARILNIYEGTNEIQRFLVLKDLPNLLASFTQQSATTVENLALDGALREFRAFAAPRLQALGARVWQDPDLQARWFPVVEWAGELYVWAVLCERVVSLERNADPADRATIRRLYYTMEQQRAHIERFAAYVQSEFVAAEQAQDGAIALVGAARAFLREPSAPVPAPFAVGRLTGEWAVIVRSRIEWNGASAVWGGWHSADLAVLDRLLNWKDRNPELKVYAVVLAPPGIDDRLRRLQAAGASLVVVQQPLGADGVAPAAAAIRSHLPSVRRFAAGVRAGDDDDNAWFIQLSTALAAAGIGDACVLASARRGEWIENAAFRRHYLAAARTTAFAWDIKPDGRSDRFDVDVWLRCLQQPLAPAIEAAPAPRIRPAMAAVADDVPAAFETPAALAQWLRTTFAGSAARETPARMLEAPVAASEVVWLAATPALASLRQQAALKFIADVGRPATIYAFGTEPTVSQYMPRTVNGVRWLPASAPMSSALAAAIAPQLANDRYVVCDTELTALANTVAHALQRPLIVGVTAYADGVAQIRTGNFAYASPLPETAVLVLSKQYAKPALRDLTPTAAVQKLTAPAPSNSALERWLAASREPRAGLAAAPIVIDVGMGVRDAQAFAAWVPPLRARLQTLSGAAVEIGATRKITQELKLLPVTQQIGQTGIAVSPRLVIALGISGAPQHMNWIAKDATVIAINRDADAPIFRWADEHGAPAIVRCVGDLSVWVPQLLAALNTDAPADLTAPRQVHQR